MRAIDADELKEHKFVDNKYVQIGGRTNGKTLESINKAYQQGWNDAIDAIIDNAPTVPLPDFKEGYKQAIIDGKTNFSRPTGKWIVDYQENEDPLFRHRWVCPVCKNWNTYGMPPYCMYCGARLEKADGQK
jgi:hypothetical protein